MSPCGSPRTTRRVTSRRTPTSPTLPARGRAGAATAAVAAAARAPAVTPPPQDSGVPPGQRTGRARQRLAPGWRLLAGAVALLALTPAVAHAWTPGTHILLGEALLRSAFLLPPRIAELLLAFPYDFLYGSIAADTSIAKKYARFGRHCHHWYVGLEILDRARDETLQSFAYG